MDFLLFIVPLYRANLLCVNQMEMTEMTRRNAFAALAATLLTTVLVLGPVAAVVWRLPRRAPATE